MTQERISISDLNYKKNQLQKLMNDLEGICAAMQAEHEATKAISAKSGVSSDVSYTINGAKNWLAEYVELIDHVMARTSIAWPPGMDGKG